MVQQAAEDRFRRFIRSGQNEDRYFDRSMIGNIFDIDTNGNHTPRTFGLAHELTAIAADPQSFDAKGNVTQIPGSLRGMTSDILLSWDFDNRLKSSTVDSTTTDYGYDATGRRVSKGSVVFVYGGAGQQNCIAEYASGAAPTSPDREFVYGDSIDSLVLISDTNDTRRLLATRNQQWSVVALVDLSDGSVVERYTYDHFGARRVLDASGAEISGSGQYGMSASQCGNPYGYTSRRHDIESGLMYFRARFYDPTTGEFLSRDPLGFVDGMSLYRAYFVPIVTDPSGAIKLTGIKSFMDGDCASRGFYGIRFKFQLEENKGPGFIVQKITFSCRSVNCNSVTGCPQTGGEQSVSFYEVWPVDRDKQTSSLEDKDGSNDRWWLEFQKNKCSAMSVAVETRFYKASQRGLGALKKKNNGRYRGVGWRDFLTIAPPGGCKLTLKRQPLFDGSKGVPPFWKNEKPKEVSFFGFEQSANCCQRKCCPEVTRKFQRIMDCDNDGHLFKDPLDFSNTHKQWFFIPPILVR